MTNYTRKIGTAVATVAILANGLMPVAFAGTTITISGNGADSNNTANVNNTSNTTVNQTNTANFTNNIDADANTGDNDANRNTGGEVNITTGDAHVSANVTNSANQNYASVDCCAQGNTTVDVSGNGDNSYNYASLNNKNNVNVLQDNDADFENNIEYLDAKTGNNDANRNTGGNVNIDTGKASVGVVVSNWANANSARVGGGDNNGSGNVSLKIIENGVDSVNNIKVDKNSTTNVTQNNYADIDNNIDADANSGDNDANRNTGGEVVIETGDAEVDVTVDNMANFNWADLNCGCTFGEGGLDVLVKKNGDNSDNYVSGAFNSTEKANQDNDADFDTNVENSDAETGNNDANKNTGDADSDPSIDTGSAHVGVDVSNSANTNGIGGNEPEWPELNLGGLNISLSFDLSDLLDALL